MEAQAAQRRIGRPPKPASERYTAYVMLKLTPPQMEAARELARREGHCPLSVYVRQLFMRHMAERAGQKEGAP